MVFHCRCFSFIFEKDDEIKYETKTQTQSTSTQTYHTAYSDLNKFTSKIHAKTSEFPQSSQTSEFSPSSLRVFNIDELEAATKHFSTKIGKGGFGSVYYGVIKSLEHPFDDIHIAVKYASREFQGHKEWETEINVLGVVKHPNLVKLVGYCTALSGTQLLLVYEYMPNKSVRDQLSAKCETPLSWTMRLKVAQDAARGLAYLHEEMDIQIIFRDFKSSNILLDDQWNAKLSDFGVARIVGAHEGLTHISTAFVGTLGYAAPEYLTEGHLSSKSDVWSYGVFLFELITGRRPLDKKKQRLTEWVKPYIDSKQLKSIIDPKLEGDYSLNSAEKLANIANCCLIRDPKSRPKMSEVLEMVNQLLIEVPSVNQSPRVRSQRNK
ncbi:serine-threonine/tyrosine-protein kinase catalytic domain-containing protein [Artemisia annua]|uniref:Serine-threonine/tyrosine-protein kinase catalytic domain-containing protein n=1 Tax=Artemisia annua TaxID=35608 RepID=A0A2U1L2V3_ARTAN|nr:serine-threonine/tyrosine-protein kinase catalytic domain-containing protein [Artemisia annua]